MDGHLGFQLLTVVNDAAMGMYVQLLVHRSVFNSLGSGTAGSYGNFLLNLLRKCQTTLFYIPTSNV